MSHHSIVTSLGEDHIHYAHFNNKNLLVCMFLLCNWTRAYHRHLLHQRMTVARCLPDRSDLHVTFPDRGDNLVGALNPGQPQRIYIMGENKLQSTSQPSATKDLYHG